MGHSFVRRWFGRELLGLLALLTVLAGAGALYQASTESRDQQNHPPPGQQVEVNGYELHLHVMGADQAGPTVILDSGAGAFSPSWAWVQPEVARFAPVVAYDRPGLGWSEAPPEPLDAATLIDDLRTALQERGLEGPYVLVGHSTGSLFVRTFTKLYPDEVAGMVLVDPRRYEVGETLSDQEGGTGEGVLRLMPSAARLGLVRLLGFADGLVSGLPPDAAAQGRAELGVVLAKLPARRLRGRYRRTFSARGRELREPTFGGAECGRAGRGVRGRPRNLHRYPSRDGPNALE